MHHASQFMISAKQLLVHNFPNTPTRHRLLNTKITADMQCIEGQIARSTLSIAGEPEKSMHTINIVSCSSDSSQQHRQQINRRETGGPTAFTD
jgi:hypothetical protein